jgi:hypothetical protein
MTNQVIPHQQQEPREEVDPLFRIIYGLGVVLIAFGTFLPGGAKWTLAGAAIVTFCCILED